MIILLIDARNLFLLSLLCVTICCEDENIPGRYARRQGTVAGRVKAAMGFQQSPTLLQLPGSAVVGAG